MKPEKYRIKETPRGKFYIQRKRWYGWVDLGRYSFGGGCATFHVKYYNTLDEAKAMLDLARAAHAKESEKDRVVHEE